MIFSTIQNINLITGIACNGIIGKLAKREKDYSLFLSSMTSDVKFGNM